MRRCRHKRRHVMAECSAEVKCPAAAFRSRRYLDLPTTGEMTEGFSDGAPNRGDDRGLKDAGYLDVDSAVKGHRALY